MVPLSPVCSAVLVAVSILSAVPTSAAAMNGRRLVLDADQIVERGGVLTGQNNNRDHQFVAGQAPHWASVHVQGADPRRTASLVLKDIAWVSGLMAADTVGNSVQGTMVSIGRNGWGFFEGDSVDLKLRSWVPSKAGIVSSAVAVGVFREDVPTLVIGKGCWEQGLTVSSWDFVARAIAKKEGGSVAALHASNNSLVSFEGSNARLYAESAVDRTDARYTVAAARVENGATLVVSPATQFNLKVGINDKATYNDQLRSYGLKVEAGYARIQSHQTNIEVNALSNAAGINIRPNPADEDKGGGADVPPSVVLAGNRTNIWVTSKNRDAYGIYSGIPEGWIVPESGKIEDPSHPEWCSASESFWNLLAVGDSLTIDAKAKRDAVGVYVEDGSVVVLGSRNTTIQADGGRSAAAFGGDGKIILAGNLNYSGSLQAEPASNKNKEKFGTTLEVSGGYMNVNSQGEASAGIPKLNMLSINSGGRVNLQDLYLDHNSAPIRISDGGVLRVNRTFSRTNDNDATGAAPGHEVASDFSIRRGGTLEISASALESAAITAGMVLRPGGMIRVFGYDQLAGPLMDERLNALRSKLILGVDSARGKSDGLIDFGNAKLGVIDLSHKNFRADQSLLKGYIDVQTDELKQTTVENAQGNVNGSYKNIVTADGETGIEVAQGTLKLNPTVADSRLVTDADGKLADIHVTDGVLTIGEQQTAGDVETYAETTPVGGSLGRLTLEAKGAVRIAGRNGDAYNIAALRGTGGALDVAGASVSVGEDVSLGSLNLSQNARLDMTGKTLTLGNSAAGSDDDSDASVIMGTVKADELTGNGVVYVGSTSGAGTVEVGTLSHSGILMLDPAWRGGETWGDGSWVVTDRVGTDDKLTGDVVVGMNSSLVVGATKEEAVAAAVASGRAYGQGNTEAMVYLAKPLDVNQHVFMVDGSATALGGTVITENQRGQFRLNGKSLAMLDVGAAGGTPLVKATSMALSSDARIGLMNLTENSEGTTIFDVGEIVSSETGAELTAEELSAALVSNDLMLEFTPTFNGQRLSVTARRHSSAASRFPGLKVDRLMDALYAAGANFTNSSDTATALLSRTASFADYGFASVNDAVATTNEIATLATSAGLYNTALDATAFLTEAVESQAERATHADGVSLWVDVKGGRRSAKRLYGTSGYDLNLGGTVFGADVSPAANTRLGGAVIVGTGRGHAVNAPLRVKNSADFVGLAAYGSRRLGDVHLSADAGFLRTKSKVTNVQAYGMSFNDDISSDTYTLGLRGEYAWRLGSVHLLPHLGIRWTQVRMDDYKAGFKTAEDHLNAVTLPVGLGVAGSFGWQNWQLTPTADVSVNWSVGEKSAVSRVQYATMSQEVRTKVVDTAPVRIQAGLHAVNEAWTLGAGWNMGIGSHERWDNTLTLKARYAF